MDNHATLLNKVKTSLRIDESDHDDELIDLISAAKKEILEVGVSEEKAVDTDELIIRATIIYCKAHFGYDDEKGKFEEAFKKMLIKLALLGSYKGDTDETLF